MYEKNAALLTNNSIGTNKKLTEGVDWNNVVTSK